MAEIVMFSGETRRLAEFLDEQLDPAVTPLVAMLSDRLPHEKWVELQDIMHRKLSFYCIAWLTWDATLGVAKRLRVTESPEEFLADVPTEINELMWADIPKDIMSVFDNSDSYRAFNVRWGELVREWASERGWDPLALPFRALEKEDELEELETWLGERGFGEHQRPIQNLLVEVLVELARRGRAFVVKGHSPEDEIEALLGAAS